MFSPYGIPPLPINTALPSQFNASTGLPVNVVQQVGATVPYPNQTSAVPYAAPPIPTQALPQHIIASGASPDTQYVQGLFNTPSTGGIGNPSALVAQAQALAQGGDFNGALTAARQAIASGATGQDLQTAQSVFGWANAAQMSGEGALPMGQPLSYYENWAQQRLGNYANPAGSALNTPVPQVQSATLTPAPPIVQPSAPSNIAQALPQALPPIVPIQPAGGSSSPWPGPVPGPGGPLPVSPTPPVVVPPVIPAPPIPAPVQRVAGDEGNR